MLIYCRMTPVQSATFGGSSNGAPLAKKKGMEHHLDVQVIIVPVIPRGVIHTYILHIHAYTYIHNYMCIYIYIYPILREFMVL